MVLARKKQDKKQEPKLLKSVHFENKFDGLNPGEFRTGGGCRNFCEYSLELKTFADIAEWFLAAI